jgi:Tol biopolymer transport system component/DNA-binding winged helix-turn-helix (wHTH) protein
MLYRFEEYRLDTDTRSLTRHGRPVVLTPKIYMTLLVLLENHARVMTKEELCDRIWPGQFMEEANLAQNISTLRRLLNDVVSGQKYIGTFHGIGYRFLATVVCEEIGAGIVGEAGSERERRRSEILLQPVHESTTLSSIENEESRLIGPSLVKEPREPEIAKRAGYPVWHWMTALVVVTVIVPLAGKWVHILRGRQNVVPVTHVVSLTRLEGSQYEASFGPDDATLAFVNLSGDGQYSLYVQKKNQLQPVKLISGREEYSSPVWSPDGKSIAFIRLGDKASELVLMDVSTGKLTHIADLFPHRYGLPYRHLDWSPDGNMLVIDDKANESDPLSLFLIYIKNGTKLQLSYPTMDIIGDVAPRFSPDGSRISFVRLTYQGRSNVFVVPVTRGEPVRITHKMTSYSDSGWLNNNVVLFTGRLNSRYSFWRSDVSGAGEPRSISSAESDTPIQFAVSASRHAIAYSAYSANLDIWSLSLTGSSTGNWSPVIETPGEDQAPEISPDGKHIAFRSNVSGTEQMWVSDIQGGNARPIDTGTLIPAVHDWDADGRGLLFNDTEGTGTYLTYLSEKTQPVKITCCHLSHPARSRDGRTIFGRTGHIIYQLNRANGSLRKITDEGGSPMAESLDSRYLYFSHGRMDSRISRVELETGVQEDVVTDLLPGHKESWALGAKGIYYLTDRDGKPVINFHSFLNGTDMIVTGFEGLLPAVGTSGFALAPDEHTLLVTRGEPIASSIQSFFIAAP